MFKLVRWVVGTLLLVSGLLQLLGLPGDIPTWLSLRSSLGWRTVLSVAMMLLGLALMIGVKHFLDHLIFRRRAVTSWQEVGLEGKWREKQWEKQARSSGRRSGSRGEIEHATESSSAPRPGARVHGPPHSDLLKRCPHLRLRHSRLAYPLDPRVGILASVGGVRPPDHFPLTG